MLVHLTLPSPKTDNAAVQRCPMCSFIQSVGTLIQEVCYWPDH
ncbi:unnamed protein product [Staurois parvus]|uniref:Uncharacterized protein n=1 Tax=Staurois parvus TaxID=386267 RepID=A0ABN9AX38_9NEOB|nr:unnamed protein product [Staurois parvus]